jgi:acyl carrier protein
MSDHSGSDMNGDDVKRRIHQFVLTTLLDGEDPANLTNTTPLVSGGVIDSLSALEVGAFLETTFGVNIAPEELANPEYMETIDALTAFVCARMTAAA